MSMKIGDKVRLIYDGRPLRTMVDYGYGEVVKITPTGLLRIKGKTKETERNELFDPYTGFAKGWNTLRFERLQMVTLECLNCGKELEFEEDSNEAKGIFNVFCVDTHCEDQYSAKL